MGAMESVVSLGNASHHLQRLASPGNSTFPLASTAPAPAAAPAPASSSSAPSHTTPSR